MSNQLREYGEWREGNDRLAVIRKDITRSWKRFVADTGFAGANFPWGVIEQYRSKGKSLEEIGSVYSKQIADGQKDNICDHIFRNLYPKFLEAKKSPRDDGFEAYTEQLGSIDSNANVEDLMTASAIATQDVLQGKQQEKKNQDVEKVLQEAFPDVEVQGTDSVAYSSKEERFLRNQKIREKNHKGLLAGYAPVAEVRYLDRKRERYEDYLSIDIKKYGVHRTYNQIKSNLRYMQQANFVHFPSHHEAYARLEDAWKTNQLIHLEGETGSGKTELAKDFIRAKTEKEPIIIKCDPTMLPAELYGKYKMESVEGQEKIMLKFVTGGVQKGMEEGRGVILDEWNQLPGDLKGPLNGLIDQLSNKGNTTEIHGDGGSELTIHDDWMIIATSNYGPQYVNNTDGSDISTKDRMTTEKLPYPTMRELGYYLTSKCMDRTAMHVYGDADIKSCLLGLPEVMSNISTVINQRNAQAVQKNTVLQDLLLKIKPLSMRRLKSWIDMIAEGRGSLRELCEQMIDQYKPDEKVQKLLVFSLFLDTGMADSFKKDYPEKFIQLTEVDDPLERLEKIAGSGKDIDTLYQAYTRWKKSLPLQAEQTFSYDAIGLVGVFHEDAGARDEDWDRIMQQASTESNKDLATKFDNSEEGDKSESSSKTKHDGFEQAEQLMQPDSFEDLELPEKVKERLIKDYEGADEEEREKALELANSITMINESKEEGNKEEGNTVEIAGKTFSFLRPEPNGKDVFAGKEGSGYEHVRYIRGDAMENYLGENDQMFAGKDDFEAFIEDNIPGKNRTAKLQNYADLMGLELSGCRDPNMGFGSLNSCGYAWVSRSDGDKAYELRVPSGNANTSWNVHKCAQPVVVFSS